MTEATEMRSLTEAEAEHVELKMLRLIRKTLADGNIHSAENMAMQFDKVLACALRAATLHVNGHHEGGPMTLEVQ